MGDWLGTGTIAPSDRVYMNFEDARKFVRSLKLRSRTEWVKYCKGLIPGKKLKPKKIPADPSGYYLKTKEWKGMGDWLGTGTIAPSDRVYMNFEDARKFVRSLKLRSGPEWIKYCKGLMPEKKPKPDTIFTDPARTYENKGWKSMGDWLGTNTISNSYKVYINFQDARKFTRSLNLNSQAEWVKYCKGLIPGKKPKPENIPGDPAGHYSKTKQWAGFGDWLGTGNVRPSERIFMNFKDARKFVHRLKLKSETDWRKWCSGLLPKLPSRSDNIPSHPERTYQNFGWINWSDWLGTNIKSKKI